MKRQGEAPSDVFFLNQRFVADGFLIFGVLALTDREQQAPPSSEANASPLSQDRVDSQENANYKIQVPVDEVRVTFRAFDNSARTVNDLKPADLDLFDNRAGPGAIVGLQMLNERPLRIGFLVDASGSVSNELNRSRAIAIAAAKALMQKKDDQGLAIGFRRARGITQLCTTPSAQLQALCTAGWQSTRWE